MEIVEVPIKDLKPADYNPRKWTEEQKEQVQKSIEEFGFVDPLIVNSAEERKNIVIGGHIRLAVASKMGKETLPVVYVDIPSLEKEKELNVRLNRNHGDWNWEALKNLFDEIKLLELGFTQGELGMLEQKLREEVDQDELKNDLDSYLNGNIRQIVLYFSAEQFETIVPRLENVMKKENLQNHTEVMIKLLDLYEDSSNNKGAGQL